MGRLVFIGLGVAAAAGVALARFGARLWIRLAVGVLWFVAWTGLFLALSAHVGDCRTDITAQGAAALERQLAFTAMMLGLFRFAAGALDAACVGFFAGLLLQRFSSAFVVALGFFCVTSLAGVLVFGPMLMAECAPVLYDQPSSAP